MLIETHTPITHWIKTPVDELICYDKEKKRPSKLSESMKVYGVVGL